LPWEASMPEEGPPPDYGNISVNHSEKSAESGRRSRQHHRINGSDSASNPGGQGEWCDSRLHGGSGSGTPGNAERTNAPFGFGAVGQSAGGGSGASSKASRGAAGGASQSLAGANSDMAQNGGTVSAGTGGSEEWPSTQAKAVRQVREPEYDDDKTQWAQGPVKKKSGRQPAAAPPPARRSPDIAESWQQEPRREAWRGAQMALNNDGSSMRAPSRLNAGTPTPREEDSLDMAARRWGGGGGGGGGGGAGVVAASGDWPGRGPLHDARTPQHQHDTRAPLGGLRGRHDLSGVYGHGR
jgi:hypothetical protein